jgi:PAS domain S-box-containing protein
LRHSEEQFRRVFDEAPIGMTLAALDDCYMRVNQSFCTMLGYTKSEAMALTFKDITHPAELELEMPCMAQIINGEIDSFDLEKRYIRKNGEILWVSLRLIALRDQAGKFLYTLAMIEDITQRKYALEALQKSEARYRGIVEDQTELICRFMPDGTLTFVNDAYCRYFNQEQYDLIGHSFMPAIPEEDQEIVTKTFFSLSQSEPIVTCEHRVILSSGEIRWQQWTNRLLFDEEGNAIEFQAVGRDITPLKQAEAEVRKALAKERELGELRSSFVSLVSHEFRTPLTTILSSSELLQRYAQKLSDEKKQSHHQRISTAVSRMTQLLDDVLTIGKAEAGKLKCQAVEMDLAAFCADVVESMQIGVIPKHQIKFTSSGNCSDAYMDENLLRHVLTNLLSNAIKYSPQGGEVKFDLVCDGEWGVFRIQDSGIGIPQEYLERLFHSFQRAGNVGTIQGTGLGLAIVKKCVDLQGGTIDVASELRVGTTFTVTLPLKYQSPDDIDSINKD